jgi:hypothetical protein
LVRDETNVTLRGMVRGSVLAIGAASVLAICVMQGCSSYVKRGSTLYTDGRYIEAAEVFERTEARLADSSPREKAEYALYRGLTLLVLGDLPHSHRWLTHAYDIERAVPGSLRQDKRVLLDRGWYELGQKMHPTAAPPPTAVAASQPPPPIPPPEPLNQPNAPAPSKRTLVPE